ncbi:MAG: hypothetical protein A2076_04150 [Geobacteraceae bacterium GWC2_53_11]|nr:MAG: hypothetical protein A2076_04150 [Geobacteraceae bacterium GWC2_53_11]
MKLKKIDGAVKARLRGVVGKGDNAVRQEICRFMQILPPQYIHDLFQSVKSIAPLAMRKIIPRTRQNYNDFFPVLSGKLAPAIAEFRWCAAIISQNIDLINSFIESRQVIEKEVLDGKNIEALVSLDEMENKFGKTLWGLELKFALIQELEGLKGNKELSNKVSLALKSPLLSVLVFYISVRNEEKATVGRIVSGVLDYIERQNIPEFLATYLRFRLLGEMPNTAEGISSILAIDKYSSILDYYETSVELLLLVGSSSDQFKECSKDLKNIVSVLEGINDERLHFLREVHNLNDRHNRDIYLPNRTIINKILKIVKNDQSVLQQRIEPFLRSVISELRPVVFREKERSTNANLLLKKLINYKSLALITPLSALLMRKVARYDSDKLYPSLFSVFNDPNREVTTTERSLETAFCKFREQKYEDAIEILKLIKNIDDVEFLWEARRLLIDAYVFNDNTKEAIEFAGKLCAENNLFSSELPFEEMLHGKKWRDLRNFDLRCLAICLNIYCDHYHDDNGQFNLRQCIAQLYKHGIKDEMLEKASQGQELSLVEISILKDILIEDNLSLVGRFSCSDDLINERLNICQTLLKIDPANSELYLEEIKEISLQIAMNIGMQKVDQNRVYVDFHGIKRWAEKEHRESFNRWVELSEIDTAPVPSSRMIFNKMYENADVIPEELLVKPATQADQLFLEILRSTLNKFLNDPKDGLNSYLSLRVRHGSLEGFLRSPFAEEGLLTEFDQEKSKHVLTEQMVKSLPYHCTSTISDLESILGRFTSTLNESLEAFVKKKLRIKSEAYPDGLIEVHVSSAMFNIIKLDTLSNVSFEKFLETIFSQFVIWTDYSLKAVRDDIALQIGSTIETAIENLRNDFGGLSDKEQLHFIRDRINRGYLAFQKALEKAADWFQFQPMEDYSRVFSIDEVMKIAIQMTKNVCPGFEPDIDLQIEGDFPLLHSLTLNIINDVLVIVLGNVHKHANVESNSKVYILIQNDEKERLLRVTVKNKVSSNIVYGANIQKIEDIKKIIEKGDHINILPTEGGSGLIKLSRLIPSDHGPIDKYLSFGFDDENNFVVSVAMPFRIIQTGEGTANANISC